MNIPTHAFCDVWLANLEELSSIDLPLKASLSAIEREKACRFIHESLRRRYELAHGMVRQVLSYYLGCAAAELTFLMGEHGKPMLIQPNMSHNWQFNLSHSGEWVAIAVTEGASVGVDIEQEKPLAQWESLVRRFFSEEEGRWLFSLEPHAQLQGFYRLWSLKESYMKATGLGFSMGLSCFSVLPVEGGGELLRSGGVPCREEAWQFLSWRAVPNYALACAIQGNSRPTRLNFFDKLKYWVDKTG